MTDVLTPSCCTHCDFFLGADGQCKLLSEPSSANRKLILTQACRPLDILKLRFGGNYDVAVERWLSLQWDVPKMVSSFGATRRDQRFWLSDWPYKNLMRSQVRREYVYKDRHSGVANSDMERSFAMNQSPASGDMEAMMDFKQTMAELYQIDAVDYALMVDFASGEFTVNKWAKLLNCDVAAASNRKYLAIYRYLCLSFEVLTQIRPDSAARVLEARYFSSCVQSEEDAFRVGRAALGDVSIVRWRRLCREGAEKSLQILGGEKALGPERLSHLETPFRRILRLPPSHHAAVAPPSSPEFMAASTDPSIKPVSDAAVDMATRNIGGLYGVSDVVHLALDVWELIAAQCLPGWLIDVATTHLITCCDGSCRKALYDCLLEQRWSSGECGE